jgi:hypothetical protein
MQAALLAPILKNVVCQVAMVALLLSSKPMLSPDRSAKFAAMMSVAALSVRKR